MENENRIYTDVERGRLDVIANCLYSGNPINLDFILPFYGFSIYELRNYAVDVLGYNGYEIEYNDKQHAKK